MKKNSLPQKIVKPIGVHPIKSSIYEPTSQHDFHLEATRTKFNLNSFFANPKL
jgi:hypothetical protein